jgi:(4-(4-[2-(gamma-L-glutamylamino)ethyl]phenoxymethyl)furan-2-yl)methanamine synthase
MTIWIGLDIGGANLKGVWSDGRAEALAFPLWKRHHELATTLTPWIQSLPRSGKVAVTMTGELADCYRTKAEGTEHITHAVCTAAAGREVVLWSTEGCFLTPAEVPDHTLQVAASNWHALATWWARRNPQQSGLIIDIGSTTTDIIPYANGVPIAQGRTDLGRLQHGELIYRGVRRTPLCAIAERVPFRGRMVPVGAEWFATMQDVCLWRREIAEDPEDRETANGRPATREEAATRLVRMLCCDLTEVTTAEIDSLANDYALRCRESIVDGLDQVLQSARECAGHILLSGEGTFLGRQVVASNPQLQSAKVQSLADMLDAELSTAACAFAVCQLAIQAEQSHPG